MVGRSCPEYRTRMSLGLTTTVVDAAPEVVVVVCATAPVTNRTKGSNIFEGGVGV